MHVTPHIFLLLHCCAIELASFSHPRPHRTRTYHNLAGILFQLQLATLRWWRKQHGGRTELVMFSSLLGVRYHLLHFLAPVLWQAPNQHMDDVYIDECLDYFYWLIPNMRRLEVWMVDFLRESFLGRSTAGR